MKIDCYGDGNQIIETGFTENPSIDCEYNRTGIYTANAYIINYGELWIDATRINHNAEIVNAIYPYCNYKGLESGEDLTELGKYQSGVTPVIDISKNVSDFLSYLGLNNKIALAIISLLILVGLIFYLLAYTQNHYVIAGVIIIAMVLLSYIGLLPKWILILIILCTAGFWALFLRNNIGGGNSANSV
jgi:hypothetical protein